MSWLTEIHVLVEKIPATFWGIVIGSFFSLSGVVVSNRANDRRLRLQLAHDRELKNRERELSLKKDVYLAAAEAFSTGINLLGTFSNLDIQHDKLTSAYTKKFPAIAKVQVIAKENTTAAVVKLSGELGSAYLRLLVKRIPLAQQKQRIIILNEQISDFAKERDRMLELMKQHNISGENDQRKWGIIQQNFNFEQERIAVASKEHDELAADLYVKQLAFAKVCINETTNLNRLIVPALIAVRAELELPIDEESYIAVVEESIQQQEAGLTEFFQQVQPNHVAQPAAQADALHAART